tara:strand:+ start:196 stop:435 length:240 start_codon:yes stop_codon:yes gene_type:complete
MNRGIEIGQLIYIPSSVRLLKFGMLGQATNLGRTYAVPQRHLITKEPVSLLVTEVDDDHIGVHYLGETWYVKQKDVYEL